MARNPDPGLGSRAGLLSVEMEVKSFNKFIQNVISENKNSTEVILRKYALDLLKRIIVKNPVRTGRSRSGWYSSMVGLGGSWKDPTGPKVTNKGIAEGKAKSYFVDYLQHPTNKYVTMINGVYYTIYLEYGSSSQAPAGMVRVSIRELMGKVPKEIEKSYKANWNKQGKLTLRKNK